MTTRKTTDARKVKKITQPKIKQGKPISILDGAERIYNALELRKRDNGDEFFCLKDGAPEWMRDVIFAGHNDRGPNDSDYHAVRDICSKIADYPEKDPEEVINEDLEASIYTTSLTHWLASHIDFVDYLTQALAEYGGGLDGHQALAVAQQMYLQEVGSAVVEALRKLTEGN